MHLLAARLRDEFLAVPQLVRFAMPHGSDGPEATLLVKASSLTLKYFLRLKSFGLMFVRLADGGLAYGVSLRDDATHPAILWSVVEHEEEVRALKALASESRCVVHLFNELAVNVAWTELPIDLGKIPSDFFAPTTLDPGNEPTGSREASKLFEELSANALPPEVGKTLALPAVDKWHEVRSTYITNRATSSFISIFSDDEGGQQEEVAVWLTDTLHPKGCVKSPQIHVPKTRELSDVLLSHEFGTVLIESKALAVLGRADLPSRDKLAAGVVKHIRKAADQLVGALKRVKQGVRITDLSGNELEVERTQPAHAIILVPDLSLLAYATEFGPDFVRKFCRESGGFLHILDPSELLRMVQVGGMIEANSEKLTRMMGFDWYLMKRLDHALSNPTPHFGMLFRIAKSADEVREGDIIL